MGKAQLSFENGIFLIAELPPDLPRAERDRWTCSGGKYTTSDLRAAVAFRAAADEKAEKVLKRLFVRYYPAPDPLPREFLFLDEHQRRGVLWALTRSRSYLAHAPGAGKTIEAIVAATCSSGAALVICPPHMVENWRREIIAWAKFPAAFEVVPDSILHRPAVWRRLWEMKFQFIAVDEASRFKEPTALRTRALFGGRIAGRTVPGLVADAKHVVLLDGSPLMNRPLELWAPTYSLSPESIDFMDRQDFGYRYCYSGMSKFGAPEFRGAAHMDELRAKLTQSFMHIVTESELSHPERLRRVIYMPTDVRTTRMRNWEEKNLPKLDFTKISEFMSGLGQLSAHRREVGLRKARFVADYVRDRVSLGEKVLLFFWHQEVGWRLATQLHDSFSLPVHHVDGTVPMDTREEIFRMFQDGRCPLIIGNIGAMGRGVNLQAADRIVFAEYSWCDETNKQAEKRASRRGSDKLSIPCDYICASGTLDEPVLNTLFGKQKLISKFMEGR